MDRIEECKKNFKLKLEQEVNEGGSEVASNTEITSSSENSNPFVEDSGKNPFVEDDNSNPFSNNYDDDKNPFNESKSTNPFDEEEDEGCYNDLYQNSTHAENNLLDLYGRCYLNQQFSREVAIGTHQKLKNSKQLLICQTIETKVQWMTKASDKITAKIINWNQHNGHEDPSSIM